MFVRVFDKDEHFVLDTSIFSPVIYISYEGGPLSPPVVTHELGKQLSCQFQGGTNGEENRKGWREEVGREEALSAA